MNHPGRARPRDRPAGAGLPDVRDRDPGRRRAGRPTTTSSVISEMWSRFSHVAAGNPNAWSREARSAGRHPHAVADEPHGRAPVHEVHELQQRRRHGGGAHHVLGRARPAGSASAADRWVFPHSGTDCHEHAFVSHRDTFARTPAIEIGGRRALALAGVGIDDIALDRPVLVLPVRRAARRGVARSRSVRRRPAADTHRRAGVRRRAVEQLRDARHRHDDGRAPRPARRTRPGVGERRLRDEALVRRVLARRRRPTASGTSRRRPRSTRSPAASSPSPTTRPARRRSRPTR